MIYKYLAETLKDTTKTKSIPSLDGLRAISIFLVIVGHIYLVNNHGKETKFFVYQDMGVSLFFVISGYLITEILLGELRKSGRVNYFRFFLKRVFRIFPAYYFFLAVSYLILQLHGKQVDTPSIISCLFYLGYYYPPELLHYWAHSWSLAIEEQFYVFWPLAINFLKKEKNIIYCLIAVIALSPILRVLTYYFIPLYKHKYHFLLHTRADTLAFGCLFALLKQREIAKKFIGYCLERKLFYIAVIYLIFIYPILHHYFLGTFRATIGYTLEAVALLVVVVHLIYTKDRWYIKCVNSKIMTHLGSISYGIYLWQQPFIYLKEFAWFKFPFNIILIYLAAIISFLLIEAPMMKLRSGVLAKVQDS